MNEYGGIDLSKLDTDTLKAAGIAAAEAAKVIGEIFGSIAAAAEETRRELTALIESDAVPKNRDERRIYAKRGSKGLALYREEQAKRNRPF